MSKLAGILASIPAALALTSVATGQTLLYGLDETPQGTLHLLRIDLAGGTAAVTDLGELQYSGGPPLTAVEGASFDYLGTLWFTGDAGGGSVDYLYKIESPVNNLLAQAVATPLQLGGQNILDVGGMAPFEADKLVVTDGQSGGETFAFDPRNLGSYTDYNGPISGDATGLARFPGAGAVVYSLENDSLWRVNIANGSRVSIGLIRTPAGFQYEWVYGLTEGPDSYLYGFDEVMQAFLKIAPDTALVQAVWQSSATIHKMRTLCAEQHWLRIDQQPQGLAVCPATSAVFSVAATSGTGTTTYQWFKQGLGDIAGATASTFTIPAAQVGDQGDYGVRVSNQAQSVTSSSASLVVHTPPTLSGPLDLSACTGAPAVFVVDVTSPGSSFAFAWYKDGELISSGGNRSITMPTSTSSVLTVSPTAAADEGSYSVVVTDLAIPCSGAASGMALLELHDLPPDPIDPSASPALICPGLTTTLDASAAPALEVRWYAGGCGMGTYLVGNPLDVTPATTTTYFARTYDPTTGCESSGCASVQVVVEPGPAAPVVTTDDPDNTLCPGDPITLSATPQVGIEHDWFAGKCGGALLFTGDVFSVVPGGTTTFYARSRDGSGCSSADCAIVQVGVLGVPTVTVTPSYVEYCDGDTILLQSQASPGTYQWSKDGVPIPGAQAASLTVAADGLDAEGSYTLQVTNECAMSTTSAPAILVSTAPRLTAASSDRSSTLGDQITFYGQFLTPGTAVEVVTPNGAVVPSSVLFKSPGDNEMTLVFDGIAPGCDCGQESFIPAVVRFDNGCGSRALEDFGLSLRFEIYRENLGAGADLQASIDGALPGTCLVLVSSTYAGPLLIANKERITLTSDSLRSSERKIYGDWVLGQPPPPDPTLTLDGVGRDVCISRLSLRYGNSGLEIRNGAEPVVRNCRMDDNHANDPRAGGITISGGSRPLIVDCSVVTNETGSMGNGSGGGVRIDASSAILVGNLISNNVALEFGSGVFLSGAGSDCILADNRITRNRGATRGGGVYVTDPSSLGGELLLRNEIDLNTTSGSGAGIYLDDSAFPRIVQNEIHDNNAQGVEAYGGGISVAASNFNSILICENEIHGNSAQVGGGMAFLSKDAAVVVRNLVYCNQAVQNADPEDPPDPMLAAYAGGILISDNDVRLYHNTIALNTGFSPGDGIPPPLVNGDPRLVANAYEQGGGVNLDYPGAVPILLDNILVENEGWEYFQDLYDPKVLVDFNLLFDAGDAGHLASDFATPGPNNVWLDPLFADSSCMTPNAWDAFALEDGSPGEGAASDGLRIGAVTVPGFVPGGCLEPSPADCNANGIPDWADVVSKNSLDGNWNGIPDECEALLTADVSMISVSAGGTQTLTLQAGSVLANAAVIVLGSFSGTSPGTSVMGVAIPLNRDEYFLSTLVSPGLQHHLSYPSILDDDGGVQVEITLPPGSSGLIGLEANHVALVIQSRLYRGKATAPTRPRFISNPIAVTLVP